MKKNISLYSALVFICVFVWIFPSGCRKAPDYVTVQHILIAFKGSIPESKVTRTREEAEVLAREILKRAEKGESFEDLVKEYSDDVFPCIYSMSNFKAQSDMEKGKFLRSRMVKAFGDVSFSLEPDEIGMAEYDSETSKYGWHIIKRLQ